MGVSGEDKDLKRLRAICAALPNVVETSSWDHANWRTGKTLFASYEVYRGAKVFSFFAGNEHQDEFLEYERFSPHRLTDRYGWVCLRLDKDADWNEIKRLAAFSHDLVTKNNASKLGKP
ncbi:MAG TPA: MmcQ/YjbR family DNA-binding protein [Elusimicrobiota bacterium]|nr:MmcQ/YjbR family DNA-binding protein [Elusimicrobiota bacterium]